MFLFNLQSAIIKVERKLSMTKTNRRNPWPLGSAEDAGKESFIPKRKKHTHKVTGKTEMNFFVFCYQKLFHLSPFLS